MKKIKALLLVAVVGMSAMLSGCTDNLRTKIYGGSMKIELPQGKKLVNATWKDAEFWYLVRDMRPGETAETWEFIEKSSIGLVEGKVIIIEKGKK